MASRIDLQNELERLLDSRHVYYQPPENFKMEYPAIRYKKSDIDTKHANNNTYLHKKKYELIVIDRKPDNPVIDKLLRLPMCTWNTWYTADNLHHDVLTLYY